MRKVKQLSIWDARFTPLELAILLRVEMVDVLNLVRVLLSSLAACRSGGLHMQALTRIALEG